MSGSRIFDVTKHGKEDQSWFTRNRGETVYWAKKGRTSRAPSRHTGGRKSTTGFNRQAYDSRRAALVTVRRLKQFWH